MERNVQLSFDAKPSESASCGAVEVERWRSARGVEVPIPTTTAVFGVMPRNAPVVVANLLLSTPEPDPQETPVDVKTPLDDCMQPVDSCVKIEPVFDIENNVVVAAEVEDAIANSVCARSPSLACTDSLAQGDDVPIPNSASGA
jgi:hypothetical protein